VSVIAAPVPPTTSFSRRSVFGLAGTVLCCAFICVFSAWIGLKAAYPFVSAATVREQSTIWEARIKRDQLTIQRMQREIAATRNHEGAIIAARRLGWVLPNERPLRVPNR